MLVLLCGCPTIGLPESDGGIADSGFDAGRPDGGDGGQGAVDAGLPLSSACTVLNARRCEFLARCGLIASDIDAVRDCIAWQQATVCGPSKWPARVEQPVATLRYDGVSAQACAEAWTTRACSDYRTEPGACVGTSGQPRYLLPNAFDKQACYDGYSECTEGVCRGASCPRTCQARGAVGEVCRENGDCKSTTLYCRLTNPATGVGACTSYGSVTTLCDSEQPCLAGLLCNAGKCAVPPGVNQPCLGSSCDESTWCLSGPDGGVCNERKSEGASCTDDLQCLPSLLCEVISAVCVPRQLSVVGAGCGLRQTCPSGTVCLDATASALGTCLPPYDAGSPCGSSNDCQAHLACFGLDGGLALGCGPRQPPGSRCTEDRDCQLLTVCRQTTCLRLPATGESCTATQSCLFGPCVGTDAGFICSEPFGPGVVCTRDADCSSARCVTGKCLPSCTP